MLSITCINQEAAAIYLLNVLKFYIYLKDI